jgi:hypothetical protein
LGYLKKKQLLSTCGDYVYLVTPLDGSLVLLICLYFGIHPQETPSPILIKPLEFKKKENTCISTIRI